MMTLHGRTFRMLGHWPWAVVFLYPVGPFGHVDARVLAEDAANTLMREDHLA